MDDTVLMDHTRLPHWTLPALLAALTVPLSLLPLGCGSSQSGDYEAFTDADAQRVEQYRADEAAATQNADEDSGNASAEEPAAKTESASPIVQAAAQVAAQAATVESSEQSAAEAKSPETNDPSQTTTVTKIAADDSSQTDRDPTELRSATQIAGERAARLVEGARLEREVKLLVPERNFTVEGPDDAIRVSYDDVDLLRVLNMDPVPTDAVEHFPDWLKDLDGKRIRMRGFMIPTFTETDIPGFLFARDLELCCFGRNPKIYDVFEVRMAPGHTTDYIQMRPFDVVGTFHIEPEVERGTWISLYHIDNAIVIEK